MNITLKNKVLLGILALYAIRQLKRPAVPELLVLVSLGALLFTFVSVPSVISNMLDSQSFYRYAQIAFSNTTLVVQMILIASLGMALKAVLASFGHLSSVGRAPLS